MKRLLITTLIIGVAVAFGVGALHASKTMAGFEAVAAQLVSDYSGATRIVSEKWQYVFVLLIAVAVSWLTLSNVPRSRSRLLVGLFLVELFALSWVCSLYRIFFQPIPSILGHCEIPQYPGGRALNHHPTNPRIANPQIGDHVAPHRPSKIVNRPKSKGPP